MKKNVDRPKVTVTLRTLLITLVVGSVLLVGGTITAVNYLFDSRLAEEAAQKEFTGIALRSAQAAARLNQRGERLAIALQNQPNLEAAVGEDPHPLIQPMTQLMQASDRIFSLFVGYATGDYLEVSDLEGGPGLREAWSARPDERWVVIQIFDRQDRRVELRRFLDDALTVRRVVETESEYRATARPWYEDAQEGRLQHTPPYLLSLVEQRGISITLGNDRGTVAGAIVLLSSLDEILASNRYPRTFGAVIFDGQGRIIADSAPQDRPETGGPRQTIEDGGPRYRALAGIAGQQAASDQLMEISIRDVPHFAWVQRIDSFGGADDRQFVGITGTHEEVLAAYREQAMLALLVSLGVAVALVPIVWYATRLVSEPIGRLTNESNKVRRRDYASVERVPSAIREVDWLSKSMVSMAVSIQDYEQKQRDLHDGFVRLIAAAIDQKSPHTGGHCSRVPAIATLLAKHASRSNETAFAEFTLASEAEQREFRIAAWLHDCGKITTPEHIVDKGTKLEANYNRIHEIRMRFEVLLREAEIRFLRAVRQDPEREQELRSALAARQQELKDEFAFVASCNIGGESMSDEDVERLEQIATRTWTRTLDDRLGLGPLEEDRLAGYPSETPAAEPLLADRPEHRIPREAEGSRFDGLGFTLKPTPLKQDLGEIYNLSVRRGTLTAEDRYIINEHICSTIEMLESLPWPEDLARVPEIAGAHHEKMDGTGYPRSLTKSQMSVAARIMAIADVMEALTAADRPYKKAKSLSASLRIMADMARHHHLDADLFRLLIESGAYREYARAWMDPDQIDDVDEAALLSGLPDGASSATAG